MGFNDGFVWEKNTGYQSIHTKYYLPDEQGFWEASEQPFLSLEIDLQIAEKSKFTYPRYVTD